MTPGLKNGNRERSFLSSAVIIKRYIQSKAKETAEKQLFLFWAESPKLNNDRKTRASTY
jgi:hypothetical protein